MPVDYHANPEINQGLLQHFGLKEGDYSAMYERLGIDFRMVSAPYVGPKLHAVYGDRKVDEWGIRRRWVEHGTGGYWDYCDWPLVDATVEQIEAWPMPSPDHFDYSALAQQCRELGQYAIVAGNPGIGCAINTNGMLRGMEQALIDLVTDDPAGLRLLDRRFEVELSVMERTLDAAAGGCDILWMGEDLGTQIGPMISPEVYRRHIRPRHQAFVDLGKSRGVKVMVHTCGSSSWAYEDFIEMGVDVVDTLQPEATDMSPGYLKEHFGGRLAFHGCISTAGPVAYGGVEDVVEDVRRTLEVMMPGGGYSLSPTHSLQSNSPIANVVAMYEAAHTLGRYR